MSYMKNTTLMLMVAGTGLMVGCASKHSVASSPESRVLPARAPAVGYDDRQIARIQRGETGEPQLLEWFGLPESRGMSPDGQVSLTWSFSRRTDGGGGHSGTLSVSLAPDGKVQAYSHRFRMTF